MNEHVQPGIHSAELPPPPLAAPAVVYVCSGIPSLFACLDEQTPGQSDPWLYLPDRVREEILAAIPASERSLPALGGAQNLDDNMVLYPLVVGGCVRAALVLPSGAEVQIDHSDGQIVLNWLLRREVAHYHSTEHDCLASMAALITCEASSAQFLRNALSLLCEQVPSGLAATYDEAEGLYRLRTAVGNITSWDALPGELPHSTAGRWLESVEAGRHFLPSGYLPERPMTLQSPPDFLFLHRGLQSDVFRSLIAVPVPGDLSRGSAERLLAIARTISRLHYNCLGVSEDLGRICRTFGAAFEGRWDLGDMLAEIFSILRRRIGLSRLVLAHGSGQAQVVLQRLHTDPVVRSDTAAAVAGAFVERAANGRFFCPDVTVSGLLTEQEAKRYYLDNVKSEWCLSVASSIGVGKVIAFGLSETGIALKQLEQLLDAAATAIHLYDCLVQARQTEWHQSSRDQERLLNCRLDTLSLLIGGHFHSMYDTIAALGGRGAQQSPVRDSLETLMALLERARRLLEYAAHPEPVTTGRLFRELPALFEGLVHNIQDTKNIAVRLVPEVSGSSTTQWSSVEIGRAFFPVLVAVMQEAICSGEIHIRETRVQNRQALRIEVPDFLIAHTTLRDILLRWAHAPAEPGNGEGECRVGCGPCDWVCNPTAGGVQTAVLLMPHPRPDSAPKTQTLSVPEVH